MAHFKYIPSIVLLMIFQSIAFCQAPAPEPCPPGGTPSTSPVPSCAGENCPICPCGESFYYQFCPNPQHNAKCSSHPNRADHPDGVPDMSGIPDPSCITWIGQGVGASGSGDANYYQPTSPAPTGPIVQKPTEPDPTPDQLLRPDDCDDPGGICDEPWDWAQDSITSLYCHNCSDEICMDMTFGSDDETAYEDCERDENCCQEWQAYYHYVAVHQEWEAYNAWLDSATYVSVFNPSQATIDAENALLQWIGPTGACNLMSQVTPGCCIAIYMCSSLSDWLAADPSFVPFSTTGPYDIGYTTLWPQGVDSNCTAPCQNVSSVAPNPATDRYIMVNMTSNFLYQTTTDPQPNPNYGAHSVPTMMYFTTGAGNIPPPSGRVAGYGVMSFQEIIEHEMGHWFGLNHPEAGGCANNNNCCNAQMLASNGEMVMTENTNTPIVNGSGKNLTSEDKLMFQKLYCPSGCDASGVSEDSIPGFNPNIYPNPSTGGMLLGYTLTNREYVDVNIYDVLGRNVLNVFSGFEDEGTQSIPLGTENLPSGNYVCRVRVGDVVSYINLVVQK